jgi:CPA1 family monovalent cation:H+ antiporter
MLEGSLVNDATGLIAYNFALAAVVTGSFSITHAGGKFVLVAAGGVAVGLVVAWVFTKLLCWIRDDLIDIVLSLVAPYLAYLMAERLHVSGVLATVVAGVWIGARSPELLSASARLTATAFWQTFVFLLNGVVFMLIGLQCRGGAESAITRCRSCLTMLRSFAAWSSSHGSSGFSGRLPASLVGRASVRVTPTASATSPSGWCGMRGVVSWQPRWPSAHAIQRRGIPRTRPGVALHLLRHSRDTRRARFDSAVVDPPAAREHGPLR